MAIVTVYNQYLAVATSPGSTALKDLSDHVVSVKVNMPQSVNEAQAAGSSHKQYRPGAGDPSIEAELRADNSTESVQYTLRRHLGIASTGLTVKVRPLNIARSSANPEYGGEAIISGDLMVMDDSWGDVPSITVKFSPFGAFSVDMTTS